MGHGQDLPKLHCDSWSSKEELIPEYHPRQVYHGDRNDDDDDDDDDDDNHGGGGGDGVGGGGAGCDCGGGRGGVLE